jgi:hypothetical protein
MQRIKSIALASALTLSFAMTARAETGDAGEANRKVARFQLSLWSSVQTSDEGSSVYGMRLNLPYGKNRDVRGFDLGIANQATGDLYGAQLGFGGYVEGDVSGVQNNLILSIGRGNVTGLQQGAYTFAGNLSGVQFGVVNRVEDASTGARFAVVNLSGSSSRGAEFGLVNHARRVDGLQLGIVNVTDELHGVQIGLANFAKNGFVPFFPVMNAAL